MSICILPEKIKEFRKALKNRTLNLNKLFDEATTTEQRIEIFKEFAGDNAKDVVALFESKLVLKNRVIGIKNAINKLGEMGRYDPKKKAILDEALSEYRHSQQERILSPKENETFLKTLTDKILGTEVSKAEAKQVFDLSVKVEELFKQADLKTETWSSPKAKADYGAATQIYKKYIDNLKSGNLPIKGMLKQYSQEIKDLWQENKPLAVAKVIGNSIDVLSKNLINAVASWDNSFIGRQGAITLIKSPKIWWNMAKKSITDIYQTMKGSNPEDVLMAEVYSDFDYIKGNYQKAKISFGIEEEVPSKFLERIPVAGKVFKASDVAFTDSAIRARIGLFKMMKKVYEATGQEMTDPILRDIGTNVNAITARGKVGQIGTSAPVRILMWAPRILKADWDILTGHTFGVGLETKFGRIQSAKTIFNVVVATAGITVIAKAMGASVETDPRSTDFLRIKVGNTRINTPFARGMPQIVTLFARLITQETKTSAGIIMSLNSGEYGSRTLFDVGIDFLVNKTTPPAGAVISWFRGKNYAGKKPTVGSTAFGFMPISVQNFIQLKEDSSTMAVFGAFADLFGLSANTYTQETDWGQSTGVELQQFKAKVGDARFKEANDKYNQQYSEWLNNVKNNQKYIDLSNEQKQSVITKKKAEIKNKIFRQYGFRYISPPKKTLPKL